jgi:D-alanine-D-alanine ligase
MMLRVLHLVGSAVDQFYCDLSRLYAQDCLENTQDAARYEFLIAYVSPDQQWRFPPDLSFGSIAASPPHSIAAAVQRLANLNIDAVIPQMFCLPGMTQYRALFELLNIPLVGNRSDLMALVAEKAKTRAVVAAAGVAVPPGEVLGPNERTTLDFPVVIKPLSSDNSLGVTLVRQAADWDSAFQTALTYGDQVLVETFIPLGREVRCGVIEQADRLVCLPLEEYALDPETRPIRSYADKLKQNSAGNLDFAAKDSRHSWIVDPRDPVTQPVWAMAQKCHRALGCRQYSLFDFRIDPQGRPWFLEAGLYCSFAKSSVLSAMTEAAGMELDAFFEAMVRGAIEARAASPLNFKVAAR